jgi:O-antigen/teichoic acid export membrane protein
LIHGIGRPDIVFLLHLAELPLYVAGAWWLIGRHGIEGAAIAWTLRAAIDTASLFLAARHLRSVEFAGELARLAWVFAVMASALLIPAFRRLDPAGHFTAALVCLATFAVYAWRLLLTREDRRWLVDSLGNRREVGR